MSARRPRLVLFDFDGVLAEYSHERRMAHLATAIGCTPQLVREVLFDSGLETAYDSGGIDTNKYLAALGAGLGGRVDSALWIASRVAGNRVDPRTMERVFAVARHARVGVLSNNGELMATAMRDIMPALFPLLDDAVLCSGMAGVRKPDAGIYRHALAHFGVEAGDVLFFDDAMANVEGARSVGLLAEHTPDAMALDTALRRHDLS